MVPAPVHAALAQAAVDEYLATPKWQACAARYGWTVSRAGPVLIIATLPVRAAGGVADRFTLRVTCDFYPTHPPDLRFVNPETLVFDLGRDAMHVPILQAPYCYSHLSYTYTPPYVYGPQLVCSSMALGYYFSGHNPTADQRWDPQRHSIGTALYTVHRALHSEHYHGRHAG